ncbi:hypothetical protein NEF87_001252 [Candidatus Lokiarchaeum ossiferum]|uniref:EF-hand domain-containing protein n=1 Tax=Candidatus Lokiarchaeum ossiferum TaxID=2951803 RepID=A0ABY6HPZ7_9ARCH|nr:hypothetical protein NEF87_001252 [Candidatus Lokiarchaeum sp. B-35]
MKKKLIGLVLLGAFFLSLGIVNGQIYNTSLESERNAGISLNTVNETDDNEDEETNDSIDENLAKDEDIDEDNDDIDDEYEDENKREVQIEVSENEIQIESKMEHGNVTNKFQVKIHWDDGIALKLEFESEYENATTESELEVEFKTVFKKIIEYVDIDGDGMFNKSNDTILQEYLIDTFKDPEYTAITQNDSSVLHYIKIGTADDVFTIHLFAAGEFMNVNSTTITPTQVKLDIEINDFPFLNSTSRLALYTKLESESEYAVEHDTEDEVNGFAVQESGLASVMNGFAAAFTWAEYANIDGMSEDVLVNPVSADDIDVNDEKIFFNYPHGTNIYHDPKIGVQGLLTESPMMSTDVSTNPTDGAISDLIANIPGYPLWIMFGIAGISIALIVFKKKK